MEFLERSIEVAPRKVLVIVCLLGLSEPMYGVSIQVISSSTSAAGDGGATAIRINDDYDDGQSHSTLSLFPGVANAQDSFEGYSGQAEASSLATGTTLHGVGAVVPAISAVSATNAVGVSEAVPSSDHRSLRAMIRIMASWTKASAERVVFS